jgi:hypothetical protein
LLRERVPPDPISWRAGEEGRRSILEYGCLDGWTEKKALKTKMFVQA